MLQSHDPTTSADFDVGRLFYRPTDFIENRPCSHIYFEISGDASNYVVRKSAVSRAILDRVKIYHVRWSTDYSISMKIGRLSNDDRSTIARGSSDVFRTSVDIRPMISVTIGRSSFLRSQTSGDVCPISFLTQNHLIGRSSGDDRTTIGRFFENSDDFEASCEARGAARFFADFCFIGRRWSTSRYRSTLERPSEEHRTTVGRAPNDKNIYRSIVFAKINQPLQFTTIQITKSFANYILSTRLRGLMAEVLDSQSGDHGFDPYPERDFQFFDFLLCFCLKYYSFYG